MRRAAVQPLLTLVFPSLLVTILLLGFPIVYVAWLSLHRWSGAQAPWQWIGLQNYADELFRDERFTRAAITTFEFSAGTLACSLILGTGLALLIDRPFRGRSIVIAALLIPIVSTPVAVSTAWRQLLQRDGFLNSVSAGLGLGVHTWLGEELVLPTLVVVDTLRWAPLVALVLLAGLSSLPREPFDAAAIDGASVLQIIAYITLPLLRPFIAVAALLRVIDAIKTFDEILVISQGGPAGQSQTLYLYAYRLGFSSLDFGSVSAVVLLIFAAVLAASLAVIRFRRAE